MRLISLGVALLGAVGSLVTAAGQTGTGDANPLAGTWRLVSLQRADPAQPLVPVDNPAGILIQDTAGHVIEIMTQAGRPASLNPAEQLMTYQASWGRYTVDAGEATATYAIAGDLNPGRKDRRVVRTFQRKDTQLVLIETGPDERPAVRATWQRIPELEALPPYQEAIVGFWQWTGAGLINARGANVRPASRDPSVIVYTPTGHMAVLYLPPPGRKPFAGAVPTVDEARAALQGSVSYFGIYIVQPKSRAVFHYQLGAVNPAAVGGSFMRNFDMAGAQVTLVFPPTTLNGEQVRNTLTLKRLSGLAEMWPEFRR
ncbi:MAG: lipocalin-like domain-containing protein [Acidobacteria bacterium]|nr:lipocalin-like domain-containing protein [Acidobacteriota bacterium]